jgi:hypothetical protein
MCWGRLQPRKRRKHSIAFPDIGRRDGHDRALRVDNGVALLARANDLEFSHWPKGHTMKTITRAPRGLGQSIFLAVLIALVPDATAQQPVELIIRNGLIVTAVGRTEGDLRIRDGTIAEIGRT